METNLTTEGTAPLYEQPKPTGCISFGPPTKYGMYISVYYTPTEEQIKNLREVFGIEFLSTEQLNRLIAEWNK